MMGDASDWAEAPADSPPSCRAVSDAPAGFGGAVLGAADGGHLHSSRLRSQPRHRGFVSSHFFLRPRHVRHPVRTRKMGPARVRRGFEEFMGSDQHRAGRASRRPGSLFETRKVRWKSGPDSEMTQSM